ncbi:hypothetical protein FB451DRAFT_1378307 [Mycena latifolia]|nr:hypothetical protein FB451DRAFT_1378307 [Mycena latifolia]
MTSPLHSWLALSGDLIFQLLFAESYIRAFLCPVWTSQTVFGSDMPSSRAWNSPNGRDQRLMAAQAQPLTALTHGAASPKAGEDFLRQRGKYDLPPYGPGHNITWLSRLVVTGGGGSGARGRWVEERCSGEQGRTCLEDFGESCVRPEEARDATAWSRAHLVFAVQGVGGVRLGDARLEEVHLKSSCGHWGRWRDQSVQCCIATVLGVLGSSRVKGGSGEDGRGKREEGRCDTTRSTCT